MILQIYSLYDSSVGCYGRPFYCLNESVAARAAADIRANRNSDTYRHPEDFIMFLIGTFDDSTGVLTHFPEHVAKFRLHEIQLPLEFFAATDVSNPHVEALTRAVTDMRTTTEHLRQMLTSEPMKKRVESRLFSGIKKFFH